MLRGLRTLIYGVAVAVVVVVVAIAAAVYVLGLAAKVALFGEPKATLGMRVLQRLTQVRPTDITDNTHHNGGE